MTREDYLKAERIHEELERLKMIASDKGIYAIKSLMGYNAIVNEELGNSIMDIVRERVKILQEEFDKL